MKRLICVLLLFSSLAFANRVPEIEEYYIKKTSELLKTRFPDKPFTVFANVETGKVEKNRKQVYGQNNSNETSLPYLGLDDEVQIIDFWARTDLPLGTLISQLEKVEVRVKIDSSISEEELNELKLSLSEQLKLSAGSDSIIIEKVDWTASEQAKKRWWIIYGFLGALLAIFGVLFLISKISVKLLAKSLAEPIAEIGKSTQAFANNALNMASDKSYQAGGESKNEEKKEEELSLGSNLLELRNGGLELLSRNIDLLKKPDVEVMEFFERYGKANPQAMGAILAELDDENLRGLFRYGTGSWWFVALSQPSPMNQTSLKILNELDRLRLRRNFDHANEYIKNNDIRDAGLVFGRLKVEQLVEVFKGRKIEEMDAILSILPKSFSLAVGKALYPGQWAILLDSNRKQRPMEMNLLKELKKKAVEVYPLRKDSEIHEFFRDLDISRYLDVANYRDEKEFYTALPETSRIKQERVPFYKIFRAEEEVIKLMASDLGVKDWLYLLFYAEAHEREHCFKAMPERLTFMVKEELSAFNPEYLDAEVLRKAKKRALHAFLTHSEHLKWQQEQAELQQEDGNEKEVSDDKAA